MTRHKMTGYMSNSERFPAVPSKHKVLSSPPKKPFQSLSRLITNHSLESLTRTIKLSSFRETVISRKAINHNPALGFKRCFPNCQRTKKRRQRRRNLASGQSLTGSTLSLYTPLGRIVNRRKTFFWEKVPVDRS